MTEQLATQPSSPADATTPAAATPFDLRIHFLGAFVFSIQTSGNSQDPNAVLTAVNVYAPTCDHMHAATFNQGSPYMLENYWHCIEPDYGSAKAAPGITLGQLKANIQGNTPWVPGNRPVGGSWSVAVALPFPPNDWQSVSPVSTTDPASSAPCFAGIDAKIVPASVATEQILIYKQVYSASQFHGVCFQPDFTPVNGVVDLIITSEAPIIPTVQHQVRAASAMAGLLGLDLTLQIPLPGEAPATGALRPMFKSGNCLMGIISGPSRASRI
jgi:hypothetical protein